MTIKYKLFLTYAIVSLVIFSLSFALLFFQVRKSLTHQIKEELTQSNQMITDMVETAATISIKNHLRTIAEKNREILESLYQEYQQTRISKAEAMDRAIQVILSQGVGKTGYIYCINSNGVAVVHPQKTVVGTNLSHHPFIRTQIQNKEGYLEYDWKNPGEHQKRPKVIYMTYFQPWDWIISVSSYKSEFSKLISVDDFKDRISGLTFGRTGFTFIFDPMGTILIHPELSRKAIINQDSRTKAILQKMQKIFWLILMVSLLVIGLVTLGVSASITKPLNVLIHRFEKGARGDWSFRMDDSRGDEIGKLSASFNLFMTQLDTYRKELTAENRVREKTEAALRNLENYLSNIINSMPSLLIGVDSKMKVTQWNRQAEALTGISMADAHSQFLPDVFPRIRPHIQKVQESLKEKDIQYIVKSPFLTQDGKTHYEDMTIYPLIANGGEGAVIRIDDVSKNVWMEEALIQNEKMLSIGGLAAGMAHEINNPLAGIIQNAAVLSNRLTDKTIPANVKAAGEAGTTMASIHTFMAARNIFSMIEAITGSALRMASIVENMLSFSRKSDDSFSSHDLTALMDKTLELAATDFNLKKNFDFKSIAIEKDYEKGLPMVACDGSKIQQVLLNILNNGAQAMCEKEASDNRKPRFILRLCKGIPNRVGIEIQDNGPGMDEETRKKIFEPFFTTKPSGMGIGLGLSVSYFIITKNHGGTMEVVSEPGKGTTFIIGLPC